MRIAMSSIVLLAAFILLMSKNSIGKPLKIENSMATELEVKLIDGQTSLEGTLLVRYQHQGLNNNGSWSQWGLLCDDGWSTVSADVACRQLGFGSALQYTVANKFQTDLKGKQIVLDDVRCSGLETSLTACSHRQAGQHNCQVSEAAGVRCSAAGQPVEFNNWRRRAAGAESHELGLNKLSKPPYHLTLLRNRTTSIGQSSFSNIGLVRAVLNVTENSEEESQLVGGVCADSYVTLREASVVCRELGLGAARSFWKHPSSQQPAASPVLSVAGCRGDEASLTDCAQLFSSLNNQSQLLPCQEPNFILGVSCTTELPDLVLDHRTLQLSAYIARMPMYFMNCALEESCAAATAFEVRSNNEHWPYAIRTLLRFSTIVSNVGNADFHPSNGSDSWTWHSCHMHYHSMPYFASYEVYQQRNGTHLTLASGHKASFCLEDSSCQTGTKPKYQCSRDPLDTGNQGISAGCSDNYLHDLDCQWIDVTDLAFGFYMFRVVLNPEFQSAESNFANNAVVCQLAFSPYQAQLHSCQTMHAFDV